MTVSKFGEPSPADVAWPRDRIATCVRTARTSDLPRLAEMYRAEAEHHAVLAGGFALVPGFDWTACVANLVADPCRLVVVAEVDHGLVGFLHGRLIVPGALVSRSGCLRRLLAAARRRVTRPLPGLAAAVRRADYGIIEDCWVEPDLRSRGVGACLLGVALEWFSRHGAAGVELQVLDSNLGARRFWQAHGFEVRSLTLERPPAPP